MLTQTKYQASKRPAAPNMLKTGRKNKKLGGRVTVGRLTGVPIFGLTLEERRTCPRNCAVWDICYGNNMPFALRYDHTSPDFLELLAENVAELACKGRVLIRLHVLGDFFSTSYVNFWGDQLKAHAGLHIFGYTAHSPESDIGQAVRGMTLDVGWARAAVRFSGFSGPLRGAVVADDPPPGSFPCPEQTGRVRNCADCGACWEGEKTVCFQPH